MDADATMVLSNEWQIGKFPAAICVRVRFRAHQEVTERFRGWPDSYVKTQLQPLLRSVPVVNHTGWEIDGTYTAERV